MIYDLDGTAIATVHLQDGDKYDNYYGNRHLLAAAPDLYAALESLCEVAIDPDDVMERMAKARAVLAKARGEA
jgi:hypothetical protein